MLRPLTDVEVAILSTKRTAAKCFLDFLKTQRAQLDAQFQRHSEMVATCDAILNRGTIDDGSAHEH